MIERIALVATRELRAERRQPDGVVAAVTFIAVLVLLQNFVVRAADKELRVDALILPVSTGALFVIMAAFGWTTYGAGTAVLLTAHLLS